MNKSNLTGNMFLKFLIAQWERLDDRLHISVGEADKRGGRNKNVDMEFFFTENC